MIVPTGTKIPGVSLLDFNTLIEFATYGITPIVSPSFKAEAVNVAPLRDRYIKLQHTINKLLYKLYSDGTMILLRREDAMRINGLHLSPQHHADSKGKPEGRIIGNLSGQHDPGFTPLNKASNCGPTSQPISMDGITSYYGRKISKVLSTDRRHCSRTSCWVIWLIRDASCFSSAYACITKVMSSSDKWTMLLVC